MVPPFLLTVVNMLEGAWWLLEYIHPHRCNQLSEELKGALIARQTVILFSADNYYLYVIGPPHTKFLVLHISFDAEIEI